MKERLEREFAILAAVDNRRRAGSQIGTIEHQIVTRHLIELEILCETQRDLLMTAGDQEETRQS